jgi:hypothetical protein
MVVAEVGAWMPREDFQAQLARQLHQDGGVLGPLRRQDAADVHEAT